MSTAADRLLASDALGLPLPPLWTRGSDLRGDHPAFPLLASARDEAVEALARNETHYTDVSGIKDLRGAVARALADWGLGAHAPERILVTAGEQEARFLTIEALAQCGYTVILPSVVHPGARKAAAVGGRTVHRLPVDPATLLPDPDDVVRVLRAAGAPGLLYIESPNRFSGKTIESARLERIAQAVLETNAVVVWDASLAPWVSRPAAYRTIASLPGMDDRTVTLGALVPGSGVDGWLSGYIAAPLDLYAPIRGFKQVVVICSAAPVQWGAVGALKGDPGVHHARVRRLDTIREQAVQLCPGVMTGDAATLVAIRVPDRPIDLTRLPATPAAGDAFGLPGALRFTVTPAGEVVEALRTLNAMLSTKGRQP